jgi:uncharacterized membrane protein YqiK
LTKLSPPTEIAQVKAEIARTKAQIRSLKRSNRRLEAVVYTLQCFNLDAEVKQARVEELLHTILQQVITSSIILEDYRDPR